MKLRVDGIVLRLLRSKPATELLQLFTVARPLIDDLLVGGGELRSERLQFPSELLVSLLDFVELLVPRSGCRRVSAARPRARRPNRLATAIPALATPGRMKPMARRPSTSKTMTSTGSSFLMAAETAGEDRV